MRTKYDKVAALATRQHGRVTIRQLLEAGFSASGVRRAVQAGRLHREHRGVFAVGHQAPSARGRWISAVLACGDGAALSHRSGATFWGIRRGEGPKPDVTVAGNRKRPGIVIHRAPLDGEVTVRDGIPVTTVARTLADLAHVLDADSLTRAVREAQYLKLFDLAATRAAAARWPSRALHDLLEQLSPASSPLDDAFIRLVRRFRLPEPKGQKDLFGHPVDYVWEAERVAVELDGYDAHVSLDAFQRDRSQSNRMQLAGWTVLRFTWADVHRRPRQTAETIRQALGRSISSIR
ncbi:MAG: hypothetical protein QOE86_2450 [Solirubrobacteraceae bacterium]|nr:hypothetical protein [Solirubrobacteraceae bacterium]